MGNGWGLEQMLIQVAFTVVWAAVVVGIFSRGIYAVDLAPSWARSHGIDLDARTEPLALWYCRLTGVLRVTGGVSGIVIGAAFDRAFGLDTSAGFGFWAWVITGWFLGAAWAERRLPRPGEAGAASLVPRRTTDYLPRGLAVAPVVAAVLAVLVAIVGVARRGEPEPFALRSPATPATFVAGAAVAVVLCAVVVLIRRSVVNRPQPLMDADLLAVDDAIRSSTTHNLSGAGAAAILCVVGALISLQTEAAAGLPLGIRGWLPLLPLLAALVLWRYWSFRYWRVRRSLSVSELR